jgi:hypothetical protein
MDHRARRFKYVFEKFSGAFEKRKSIECKYHLISADGLSGFIWFENGRSSRMVSKMLGGPSVSIVDAGSLEICDEIRGVPGFWENVDIPRRISYFGGVKKDDWMIVSKRVLDDIDSLKQIVKTQADLTTQLVKRYDTNTASVAVPTIAKKSVTIADYLSTTCKAAVSIREFIGSLEVLDEDLMYMKDYGYIESVSRWLNRGFSGYSLILRPIHCIDMKREILYIKDDTEWKKERIGECPTIDRMFRQISQVHRRKMADYYQGVDIESKAFEEKARVMYQIACAGGTDEEACKKKIMKKLVEIIRLTL